MFIANFMFGDTPVFITMTSAWLLHS